MTDTTTGAPSLPWATPIERAAHLAAIAEQFKHLATLAGDVALAEGGQLRVVFSNAPDYLAAQVDAIEATAEAAVSELRGVLDVALPAQLAAQEARLRGELDDVQAEIRAQQGRAAQRGRPTADQDQREQTRAQRAGERTERAARISAAERAIAAVRQDAE